MSNFTMMSEEKDAMFKNPSWWKRRTTVELCLIQAITVISFTAIALIVILVIVLVGRNDDNLNRTPHLSEPLVIDRALQNDLPIMASRVSSQNSTNVCMTEGCNRTASRVLSNMDLSVDPCDDFYRFACGSFINKTSIPDDKSSVTSFTVLNDLLQVQLRTMIEEPVKPEEPDAFVQMKRLYSSCMNTTAIQVDGLKTIKSIIKGLGGWPVIEGQRWNQSKFEWTELVYKFRKAGYSLDYFMAFSVAIDYKNTTKRVIEIDQAILSLDKELFSKGLGNDVVRGYYDYMVDIAVMFGANRTTAKTELQEALEFEMKLSNASMSMEDRRNHSLLYNPISIGDLEDKFPSVCWLEYVNSALNIPNIQIQETDIVIVSVPSYISELEKLINSTSKRTQANYVIWRAIASSIPYLTEELRQRELQYTKLLNGRTTRVPRWKECTDIVTQSLSVAVGALYVRKYFTEDARVKATELISGIKKEFINILKGLDWMDNVTRSHALEKANAMVAHVAYPDELLSDKEIEGVFEGLNLNFGTYLEVRLSLTRFAADTSFKKLNQPVKKGDWTSVGRPAVINAFYSFLDNSMQFPAGILQGVFFDDDRPQYMNYGAIGFVAGHEITHGFDDQGRQFDKDGNMVDWWAPSTKAAFLQKAQCIINQYGNYSIPELGLNVNGINTQGENIADNGGIKEAYLAYRSWVQRHGPEPRLPGLNYTAEQMFWISGANVWCSRHRLEALRMRIINGYHSPDNFRVQGPLSNSPIFAKDFNCPAGSKMNPVHKCTVW